MRNGVAVLLLVYVAGVLWGLLKVDAAPPARLGLALIWPIGPLAFLLTVAILIAAAAIAFPLFGLAVAAAAGAAWFWAG